MTNEKSPNQPDPIDEICINTIRTLTIDAIEKANSGHPGAPMGLAPAAYVLWTRFLRHCPEKPDWLDRDRFVLSGGHASMLLYSLLHLTGYDVSLEDLKQFRQFGGKTPGHPEFGHTPGVETTTGPLGQGFANSVGMAIAERHLAERFNRPGYDIVDHYTYVMCGDGDLMEGISSEAASLAGHLGLSRLICIYDDNRICIEGGTNITFTEDVGKRFDAYGWQVLRVPDGNDTLAIDRAIAAAKADAKHPSLIVLTTEIACGSPNKQGSADAHGAPLGNKEVCLTKACLHFPPEASFYVPEKALARFRECSEKGSKAETAWEKMFRSYAKEDPETADQWLNAVSGFLPAGWDGEIPEYHPDNAPIATRAASGQVLNAIANNLPTLMGGSADLAPSNKTYLNDFGDLKPDHFAGRNIRFGVREHAMGGILNGMYLHHGLRPYGGTFLVFSDYLRPSIRLAALMKLAVIYVFTHDSIAVGEDGPTHQPVEHLAVLRAIPGLTVIRPADANETAAAWRQAVRTTGGPVALILSRQKLPILSPEDIRNGVMKGAYILRDTEDNPELILIASGSEVHLALSAAEILENREVAVRVVSMPSWELFEKNPKGYKNRVFPPDVTARIAIEAGSPMGWERYVGDAGTIVGIDRFGISAPGNRVMEEYGFTADRVVEEAMALLDKRKE